MFPAGRQLPHLTSLEAAYARQPPGGYQAVPEGSHLVSCCPELQRLDVSGLAYSAGVFSPLQALSGLQTLTVSFGDALEAVREVCELTGLRELDLHAAQADDQQLLQTTQLKQLTRLHYYGPLNRGLVCSTWVAQVWCCSARSMAHAGCTWRLSFTIDDSVMTHTVARLPPAV